MSERNGNFNQSENKSQLLYSDLYYCRLLLYLCLLKKRQPAPLPCVPNDSRVLSWLSLSRVLQGEHLPSITVTLVSWVLSPQVVLRWGEL